MQNEFQREKNKQGYGFLKNIQEIHRIKDLFQTYRDHGVQNRIYDIKTTLWHIIVKRKNLKHKENNTKLSREKAAQPTHIRKQPDWQGRINGNTR